MILKVNFCKARTLQRVENNREIGTVRWHVISIKKTFQVIEGKRGNQFGVRERSGGFPKSARSI